MAWDEKFKRAVWSLRLSGVRGDKRIMEALEKVFPGEEIPGERTIYRFSKDLEARYTPEEKALDQPFQLHPDLPEGVTRDSTPHLLKIINLFMQYPTSAAFVPVTVRVARWISLLSPALKEDPAEWLWLFASQYASRERWAKLENKPFRPDDLNKLLASGYWRSVESGKAYIDAVEEGRAPDLREVLTASAFTLAPLDSEQGLDAIEVMNRQIDLEMEILTTEEKGVTANAD